MFQAGKPNGVDVNVLHTVRSGQHRNCATKTQLPTVIHDSGHRQLPKLEKDKTSDQQPAVQADLARRQWIFDF